MVVIQALIGKDGRVKDMKVRKSSPPFDEAATAAVRQWIFRPAIEDGEPVAIWVTIPVRFPWREPSADHAHDVIPPKY